jgi:hypothetical protein
MGHLVLCYNFTLDDAGNVMLTNSHTFSLLTLYLPLQPLGN